MAPVVTGMDMAPVVVAVEPRSCGERRHLSSQAEAAALVGRLALLAEARVPLLQVVPMVVEMPMRGQARMERGLAHLELGPVHRGQQVETAVREEAGQVLIMREPVVVATEVAVRLSTAHPLVAGAVAGQ